MKLYHKAIIDSFYPHNMPQTQPNILAASAAREKNAALYSRQGRFDLLYSFHHVLAGVEGGKTDVALAAFTEACARRADHACLVQQHVEEFP